MNMLSKRSNFKVNKGLLWKEWQQNKLYFLIAFLIMSYDTIIKPLGYGIKGLSMIDAGEYTMAHALSNISSIFSVSHNNTMEQMGVFIVILLGIVMLIQERSGSFYYLVSTPVSRTEIILAKFLTGSAAITGIVLINTLFVVAAGLILPVNYGTEIVLNWAVLTTAAFLALFSLGLMIASFTGRILSAVFLAMLCNGLPSILGLLLTQKNALEIFNASSHFTYKVNMIVHYLTIPAYITRESAYMQSASSVFIRHYPNYPLETFVLVLLMGVFVLLAVKVFKNNALENNGNMFMSDRAHNIAKIIVAAIIALGHSISVSSTISGFLESMAITFVITYVIIILLSVLLYYVKLGIAGATK